MDRQVPPLLDHLDLAQAPCRPSDLPHCSRRALRLSRWVAIEAARSIIQQLARSPRDSRAAYWTLPYHTISAVTTLMLDIFQSPEDPDVLAKHVEVQHALYEL